ncbi:trehalase, partial [Burkholderia sp. SIMBA_048]
MIVSSQWRAIRAARTACQPSPLPSAPRSGMKSLRRASAASSFVFLLGLAGVCHADTQVGSTLPPAPSTLDGDLFVAVQTA